MPMLAGAGEEWLAVDIAFKPYACGTMAHPYIDCARKLVAEGAYARGRREHRVQDGRGHRASVVGAARGEAAAAQRLRGEVQHSLCDRGRHAARRRGPARLSEEVVHDPAVRALAGKVRYAVDPDNPYPRRFTGHRARHPAQAARSREASQDTFAGGRDEPM
jgi:hypothetical protein